MVKMNSGIAGPRAYSISGPRNASTSFMRTQTDPVPGRLAISIAASAAATFIAGTSCMHTPAKATPNINNGPTSTNLSSFDVSDPGAMRRNAEPWEPAPPNLDDANHPGNRLAVAACDRKLECD